jgi:uncharacterized protein (TIGR02996 family)
MIDHVALMAAVIADPDDDLPRLRYADALEADGDHDWAEFVRLEVAAVACERCQSPKKTRRGPRDCGRCEYCRAQFGRYEARGLFTAIHERAFCRWLPDYTATRRYPEIDLAAPPDEYTRWSERVGTVEVYRGFIERIRLPWEQWEWYHATVRAAHPVTSVVLENWPPKSVLRRLTRQAKAESLEWVLAHHWPGIVFRGPAAGLPRVRKIVAEVHR